MIAIIRRIEQRSEFRFALVGVTTLILPMAVSLLMKHTTEAADQTIFFLSSLLAIELNFLLNHMYTWRGTWDRHLLWGAWWRFHAGKAVTILIGQALFYSINIFLNFYYSYVITVALMTLLNYTLQSRFVFKR